MKNRKMILMISLSVGIISFSFRTLAGTDGWVYGLTPSSVFIADNEGPYSGIYTSQPLNNPASCSATDFYVYRDSTNVTSVNASLATVLSALATQKPIRIFVTAECDAPTGRPLITAVGIN
jgi:hypothetical protein